MIYIYINIMNIYIYMYISTENIVCNQLFTTFPCPKPPHPQPSCTCWAWFRCAQVLHTSELESYLEVCHPGFHIIGKMLGAPWDGIYRGYPRPTNSINLRLCLFVQSEAALAILSSSVGWPWNVQWQYNNKTKQRPGHTRQNKLSTPMRCKRWHMPNTR